MDQPIAPASAPGVDTAPTVAQSAVVELGLGIVGLIIIVVTGRSLADALHLVVPLPVAIGAGLAVGAVLALAFGMVVSAPGVAARVTPFLRRFTSSELTVGAVLVLAVAAAGGEELLFRAAIQPVAGIGVAALLFTAAHSAIADFRHPSPGKAAYAVFAFLMGIVLGVLYATLGLAASASAHFAFDAVALLAIRPLVRASRASA